MKKLMFCVSSCTLLMFTACEKEIKPTLNLVDNSTSANKKLTAKEINEIRAGYKTRLKKNNIFEGGHTEYIPMQNAVDIFEVVLNSEYAVRYEDEAYDIWELDVFDFELEFTNVNTDYLFNLMDVYVSLEEIEEFVQERDLSNGPDRKFIAIDIEPLEVVGEGKFRFTYTTVSARVSAKTVNNVEDYFDFNWRWGKGSIYDQYGNKPLFGCYPDDQNERTRGIGGACGVLSANLNKYFFTKSGTDFPEQCSGVYSTSLKTVAIHQGEYSGYRHWFRNYDEDGLLMAYVQNLEYKCVSGAELRDVWMPYIINKAKEERVIDKNPYKMRRGSEDRVNFFVTEAGSAPFWNQQLNIRWEDPQCTYELMK